MKDRKNWSSELKMEEVSAGLETVKEQLNERVVCLLIADMEFLMQ